MIHAEEEGLVGRAPGTGGPATQGEAGRWGDRVLALQCPQRDADVR